MNAFAFSGTWRSRLVESHALSVVCLANEGVEVGSTENEVDRASELLLKLVVDHASRKSQRRRRFDYEVVIGRVIGVSSCIASKQRHLREAVFFAVRLAASRMVEIWSTTPPP